MDRFEHNDTAATATPLGSISGTLTQASLDLDPFDPDWYRFSMPGAGRSGDRILVSFNHAQGDIDIELFASDGTTLLALSDGTGNSEEISLAGRAAGTYLLRVSGYGGESSPNYTLQLAVAPAAVPRDRLEDNDTPASATVLAAIAGTLTESGLSVEPSDSDWFRFSLTSTGRSGDRVALSFVHTQGDIDLAMYAADGSTVLARSEGTGNAEEVSLEGRPAGTYYARVYGYDGSTNPSYAIGFSVAPNSVAADRFENNDSAATATDLRTVSGTVVEEQLSIQPADPDWYRFTMPGTGRSGDFVAVAFSHDLGDLDLVLFAADGTTRLAVSEGTDDIELISLAGRPAGTYFVQVFGYGGVANPDYTLGIATTPVGVSRDRFEDNDSAATASDLRVVAGTVSETALSIEPGDADWFRFTLSGTGGTADRVALSFNHAQGDIDLALYAADGRSLLAQSEGTGSTEEITLAGRGAGTYYVRVYGYEGAANPAYALEIKVAATTAARDRFEDNDSAAAATDLRSIGGVLTESALSIEPGDVDWYRFTLPAGGRSGDKVSLAFVHAQGDVDMQLYNAAGTALAVSEGSGNSEEIALGGLAAGTYLLQVYGYGGVANPAYSLTLSAAAQVSSGDRLEDNDTPATATDLRVVSGTRAETGLSIEPGDADWFRFTLGGNGRNGDKAVVDFTHGSGDIDLQLFAADGSTLLATSDGSGNREEISLSGRPAGTYLLKVYGYGGAANPTYALSLSVAATSGLVADAWEANDSAAQATRIRQAQQSFDDATITAGDQDWYTFSLPGTGVAADRVALRATGGDLTLRLVGSQGQTLASAQTDATGQALLPLANVAAGNYHVQVSGASAGTQATYDLDVRAGGAGTTATGGSWTLLVYIAGDNNLEGAGVEDVNEMEAAAVRAGINFGVLFDRSPQHDSSNGNWSDTRRGVIVQDSSMATIGSRLEPIGEVDTGRQQTLTDFINWGAANLPAQRYALVVWNHDGGSIAGSASDDSSAGSSLSNRAVRDAIAGSSLGRVDVVGFDACLMAMVETGSELASVASMLVASQQTEGGDGWEYTSLLNRLSAQGGADPAALASLIVDTYVPSAGGGTTLSAIDLARIAAVETAINGFATVMRNASAADWAAVQTARVRSTEADRQLPYSVDLVDFMTELQTASGTAAVDAAALAVADAVRAAVSREVGPSSFHGLSVVFPDRTQLMPGEFTIYTAAEQRFLANTAWDDFLNQYLGRGRSATSADAAAASALARAAAVPLPDFAEAMDLAGRPRSFDNGTQASSLDLGRVASATFRVESLTIDSATDVDWFRFSLPTGAGLQPTLTLSASGAAVAVRVLDAAQAVVASGSTVGGRFSTAALVAGGAYSVEVRAADAAALAEYGLLINAFGAAVPASPLPDAAESEGGNGSRAKAYVLGAAQDLELLGGVRNLSFDAADIQGGATGGDWFAVTAVRTTAANARWVAITDPSAADGDLSLRVYSSTGSLLAESAHSGSSYEAVRFEPQVSTVYVQVTSASGRTTADYRLQVRDDVPTELDGSAAADVLIDLSGAGALLRGLGGNDQLDGSTGIDTAAYTAARAAHGLARTTTGWTVSSPSEGVDTLLSIERLRFADRSVALDLDGNAAAVARTLGAVFGAASVRDPVLVGIGLHFADAGLDATALMRLALDARLGSTRSNAAVVDLLYTNVVGQAPTAADRQYFVGLLDSGAQSQVSLGVLAAEVSLNLDRIDLTGLQQSGLDFVPYTST